MLGIKAQPLYWQLKPLKKEKKKRQDVETDDVLREGELNHFHMAIFTNEFSRNPVNEKVCPTNM